VFPTLHFSCLPCLHLVLPVSSFLISSPQLCLRRTANHSIFQSSSYFLSLRPKFVGTCPRTPSIIVLFLVLKTKIQTGMNQQAKLIFYFSNQIVRIARFVWPQETSQLHLVFWLLRCFGALVANKFMCCLVWFFIADAHSGSLGRLSYVNDTEWHVQHALCVITLWSWRNWRIRFCDVRWL